MIQTEPLFSILKGRMTYRFKPITQHCVVTKPSSGCAEAAAHVPTWVCMSDQSVLPSAGKKEEVNSQASLNFRRSEWRKT